MNLLDEDGLCRLSGFKPEECGCDKHRGKGIHREFLNEMEGKQPPSSNISTGIGFTTYRDDQ